MSQKKIFQFIILTAILLASFATTGSAFAWSGCGTSYVVQSGDTLGSIAAQCGTSISALQSANPNMGYWIYAGQTLWISGSSYNNGNGYSNGYSYTNGNGYGTYIVEPGDTLKTIADRYGTTMANLASMNSLYNYDLIYVGQVLRVPNGNVNAYTPPVSYPAPVQQAAPVSTGTYVVTWGDTLRKIADRLNINVNDLIAVNPQLWNPNLIFIGQVINIPASASDYTIQNGDTLKTIAWRFGTTLSNLLALNPQIWNADWIYAGQVIRVW
jgi:peptidoglycan endopeptidase LytE